MDTLNLDYEENLKLFKQYAYRRMDVDADVRKNFVEEVLKLSEYRTFLAGEEVVKQGEINDYLFIMLNGTCDIVIEGKYYVSLKRRGDIIGEMSVIRNIPCSATVIASSDVLMLALDREAVTSNIEIVSFISAGLSQKLEWATKNVQNKAEHERSIVEKDAQIASEVLQVELIKNKELQKAYQAVKKAEETKDEILKNITHELKTPLNGILGFAQIILNQKKGISIETLKEYVEIIHQNGNNLLVLVKDLIEISKLYSGTSDFIYGKHNILDDIQISIDFCQVPREEKQIKIRFLREGDPPLLCFYDRAQIQKVITHLIQNAIQFSDEKDEVTIDIEARPESCIVSVRDNGCGIPSDEYDLIFESFAQSSRTNDGSGGKGLGLAISKSIISSHQEEIWVENNKSGKGSCFKFSLSMI